MIDFGPLGFETEDDRLAGTPGTSMALTPEGWRSRITWSRPTTG